MISLRERSKQERTGQDQCGDQRGQLQRRRKSRGHARTKAKGHKGGIQTHEVRESSNKEMVPITGRQEAGAGKERGGGRGHDRVKNDPSRRTRK